MEESLREELLARTKVALDADDWEEVERLWQPWLAAGDVEAQYQIAYHYLYRTPCDDDAYAGRMRELMTAAAAKDHPDAIWFLATIQHRSDEPNPEMDREVLRAGRLGSTNAQRELGVLYSTGRWSGPKDSAEGARWYRLAAEKGHALSQYDLGFMLLLGEGCGQDVEKGIQWLARSGEQGESSALRLLMDCFENGYFGVPKDAERGAFWRSRYQSHEHSLRENGDDE
jgi:TPR repeat protein